MIRRFIPTLMMLGLFSSIAILSQPNLTSAQDKKESKKKDEFRDQWPKYEGTVVKIVKVEIDKKSAELMTSDGKTMSVSITAETKFVGPRGGKTDLGIKDDRFVAGYTAKVVLDDSKKNLKEVYLSIRPSKKSTETKPDANKDEIKKDEKKEDPKKKTDKK